MKCKLAPLISFTQHADIWRAGPVDPAAGRWSRLPWLPVDRIKHLNDYECGESHAWWLGVIEDATVKPLEVLILYQALAVMGLKYTHQTQPQLAT